MRHALLDRRGRFPISLIAFSVAVAIFTTSAPAAAASGPDLVVSRIAAPPAAAPPGGAFEVRYAVRNRGDEKAGRSVTRFYLSLNRRRDAQDIRLTGNRRVPPLARGRSSSRRTEVTVPSGTPLASFFVLACANDRRTVNETNTRNNCHASSKRVSIESPTPSSLETMNQPRSQVVAGHHITTSAGESLWIRARDQFGEPMNGVVVVASAAPGPLQPAADSNAPRATTQVVGGYAGVAAFADEAFSRLVIQAAGDHQLVFSAATGVTATLPISVVPGEAGAPDSVVFDEDPAVEQRGGTELVDATAVALTVTVTDEFTNEIPSGTVTFEILDGAVVVDTQGATITDGAAAVPATLLAPLVAGSYTLRVVVDGTAPEVDATAPFLVALGFEDADGVVAGAQTVNTDLVAVDAGSIRVRLLDATGSPDDGETVIADLISGSGMLTGGTLSQPTDINGVATFGGLQVDAVDTYEIRFTVGARTIVVMFDAAP